MRKGPLSRLVRTRQRPFVENSNGSACDRSANGSNGPRVPVRARRKLAVAGDPSDGGNATDANADEWPVSRTVDVGRGQLPTAGCNSRGHSTIEADRLELV